MLAKSVGRYLNLRTALLVGLYGLVTASSYWLCFELRFDFLVPEDFAAERLETIGWVVALQLMLLAAGGQIDSILSYFRLPDAMRLFGALFANCLVLLSMWYVYSGDGVPPRAVILTHFILSFLLIAGFRIAMRLKSSRRLEDWIRVDAVDNVIIVGAGEVGAALCNDLMHKAGLGMRPVAFLDDDERKIGRYVHGLLVADRVDELARVASRYSADKVAIAFPSASVRRVGEVAKLARETGLAVDTVPALTDIVSGRAEMSQLRPIELEDLLGRDPVDLDSEDIRSILEGKRVLITGAGGSIGSELVRQILEYRPAELLCVDQAEIAIFNLKQEVLDPVSMPVQNYRTLVADVLNSEVMRDVFQSLRPEVVFHAAAHKHVELMESQPDEAIRNNFFATAQLAALATEFRTDRFILISTDKAINPTSVMGAAKRLAELAITAQQHAEGNETNFMAVRFGNVLGSSGSVIPIFRRQIANGGPVTVRDPEVTRFFMTVEEAVGLVLQSATLGSGGEIFVLDMGESVRILDVARQMISLSGLKEGEDVDIVFTGLLPGEKLFEEVQHLSEVLMETRHPRILRFVADKESDKPAVIDQVRNDLGGYSSQDAPATIKAAICKYVPEYTPSLQGQ